MTICRYTLSGVVDVGRELRVEGVEATITFLSDLDNVRAGFSITYEAIYI